MTARKALFLVCLAISVACLGGGYAQAGLLQGALAALLPLAGFLYTLKNRADWIPRLCLLCDTALALTGILESAPAILMLAGLAASLACWDLVNLENALSTASQEGAGSQIEKQHLRWLFLSLGLGLSLAAIGTLVTLQIPLIVVVLLVVVDMVSLNLMARYLGR
jgi:hypothetical protein